MLLYQLLAGVHDRSRKDEIRQPALRQDLVAQVVGRSVAASDMAALLRGGRSGTRHSVNLEVRHEAIGQDVVLLGALFGNDGFKCLAEQRLVAACVGAYEVKQEIGSGHQG